MRQVRQVQQIQGVQIQVQNFSPSFTEGHKLGKGKNDNPEEPKPEQEKVKVSGRQNVFFDFDETLTRHDQGQAVLDEVLKKLRLEINYKQDLDQNEENPVKQDNSFDINDSLFHSDFFHEFMKQEYGDQETKRVDFEVEGKVYEMVRDGIELKKLYDVYYSSQNPHQAQRKEKYPWDKLFNKAFRTQYYSEEFQKFQVHVLKDVMKKEEDQNNFLQKIFCPKSQNPKINECDTWEKYVAKLRMFFKELVNKGQKLHILTLNIGEVQRMIIDVAGLSVYFQDSETLEERIWGYREMDLEGKYLLKEMSPTKMDFMKKEADNSKENVLSILVEDSGSQKTEFEKRFSEAERERNLLKDVFFLSSDNQYFFELIGRNQELTSGGLLESNCESILGRIDQFQNIRKWRMILLLVVVLVLLIIGAVVFIVIRNKKAQQDSTEEAEEETCDESSVEGEDEESARVEGQEEDLEQGERSNQQEEQ